MTTITTDTKQPCDAEQTCLHATCQHCDRRIRARGTLRTDHPGTVQGSIRIRLCFKCRTTHGAPEKPEPLWWLGKPCKGCSRTLRRNSESIKDKPGTLPHTTGGYCATCYHRGKHLDENIRQPGMGYRTLSPDDLEDQRHILLSDAEMDRMQAEQPTQYAWHLNRRWGMYEREMKRIRDNNETISAEKFELLAALTSRPKPRGTNGFGSTGL